MPVRLVLSVVLLFTLCGTAVHGEPDPYQQQAIDCATNLKHLGMALEMWAVDHDGKYPERLADVTPEYLLQMPTCPSARTDTYSHGYSTLPAPRFYQFYCEGLHHGQAGLGENRPFYDGEKGVQTD